jgi:hypothetical protein
VDLPRPRVNSLNKHSGNFYEPDPLGDIKMKDRLPVLQKITFLTLFYLRDKKISALE